MPLDYTESRGTELPHASRIVLGNLRGASQTSMGSRSEFARLLHCGDIVNRGRAIEHIRLVLIFLKTFLYFLFRLQDPTRK
jgi:hypothetical protein